MKTLFLAGVVIVLSSLTSQASNTTEQSDIENFNAAFQAYSDASLKAAAYSEHKAVIPLAAKVLELGGKVNLPHDDMATLLYNLAMEQYLGASRKKAESTLDKAILLSEQELGEDNAGLVRLFLLKSKLLSVFEGPRGATSRRYLRRALAISEAHYGDADTRHASTLLAAADYWARKGDRWKIHRRLSDAIEIYEETGTTDTASYGSALLRRGKLELALGKERKSVTDLNGAIQNFDDTLPAAHPIALSAHQFLVQAYEELDMQEEADKHCRHIASVDPEDGDGEPVAIYRTMMEYPMSAQRAGREGWVVVNFTIDSRGQVQEPTIVDGHRTSTFSKSALEAINQWRFRPGYEDGKFVDRPDQTMRMVYQMAD
jgi:TonB family protein